MKRLFIDFSHLSHRALFTTHGVDFNRDGYDFHKHIVLNTILSNIKTFSPDEVILAIDDRISWRKKLFPEYKEHRAKARDAHPLDFNKYYAYIDEYLKELKLLPFKQIKVPFCEADDVVAVLSKRFSSGENIILTSDKDYIQLTSFKHNKMFCPLKKAYIKEKEPLKHLKIKILCGDKSDNIPAIKPRLGEKTAIKLIELGSLVDLLKEDEVRKNYERNEKLISFDFIPLTIQKEIIKIYDNYQIPELKDYQEWFIKNKLRKLGEQSTIIFPIFRKLTKKKEDGIENLF